MAMPTGKPKPFLDIFENIDNYTSRLKVPNGWIVRTLFEAGSSDGGASTHTLFYPDKYHLWELERSQND